jgi:hypothetical protein
VITALLAVKLSWTGCKVITIGKTKPPLALVKLLKVLDRHPDLLGEVRAA